jgi:hypothetical protein
LLLGGALVSRGLVRLAQLGSHGFVELGEFLVKGGFEKGLLFGRVVQPLCQLLQLPGGHQFAQVSVHRSGQARKVLTPVDTTGLQPVREVRSSASQGRDRQFARGFHDLFFIEISCILSF